MHAATPSWARWWPRLAPAVLLAAAVLAYWPALSGGFIWDDDTLLTASDLVKAADGLHRIWFTTEPLDYWPLTNSSFWLEWRLWGMHATGYHVTNLLLHFFSGLLVWTILRRLSIPGALLAAFAFVLHPVNVESVAWIAQRKNALSMAFFLLSILWYLKHELDPVRTGRLRAPKSRGRRPARPAADQPNRSGLGRWYWLSLAAFVLAMLSKGSVAILPGVLLLLIWWRRGSVTRRDVLRTLPFFVVAAALTLVNVWFQIHLGTEPIRHVTLVQRVLGAGAVIWFYLYKALFPIRLIFVYPQWEIRADDVRWWVPLAAAVATTAVLIRLRGRPVGRALLFAWAFFCLALLPVMGLTDVYYMKFSPVADHYQYIAIIGVVSCVAAGLSRLTTVLIGSRGLRAQAEGHQADGREAGIPEEETTSRMRGVPLVAGVLCGAWLAVLGTTTWRQSHQYANAETLYRSTLSANPSCWLVHNLLGLILIERSMDEGVSHFREAARLKPDMVEARNNLCNASHLTGRVQDAIAECSAAVRLNPNLPVARNGLGTALASVGRSTEAQAELEAAVRLDGDFAEAHNNLANVLAAAGHDAEAIQHYREALRVTPAFAGARSNLAAALEKQGRVEEAIEQYREALRIDPGLAGARRRLDALVQKSGRLDEVARYQEAVRLHPEQAGLHVNLGDAWLEASRPREAAAEYTIALKSLPDSPAVHNGLAVALDDLGRSAEAEVHFREAIRLKPDFAEAHQRLGDLLLEGGRLDEAAVRYSDALKYDPQSAEGHNNFGVLLVRLGRVDEAVDQFRAALALQPDYTGARDNLAKTLARQGGR
jgi:tetratricopeptide (TPR) repeat protein